MKKAGPSNLQVGRNKALSPHFLDAGAVDAERLEDRLDDMRSVEAGFVILLVGFVMLLEMVRKAHCPDLEPGINQSLVARQGKYMRANAADRSLLDRDRHFMRGEQTQGHTQSLHTNALDEALALPTDFSARIARNTQLVLQQESGTTRPIDPWGGSYYVEWLTHQLAEKARAHIREVAEHGGMAQAIGDGIPKLRIEEAAARTQARIDSGRQTVIGVNKYQVDEDQEVEVLKVENSRVRAEQIAKLEKLRAERDEAATQAALAELTRRQGIRPARGGRSGNNLLALADQRGPRAGDGRRDLRCAREGVRTPPGRDPHHRGRLPG